MRKPSFLRYIVNFFGTWGLAVFGIILLIFIFGGIKAAIKDNEYGTITFASLLTIVYVIIFIFDYRRTYSRRKTKK